MFRVRGCWLLGLGVLVGCIYISLATEKHASVDFEFRCCEGAVRSRTSPQFIRCFCTVYRSGLVHSAAEGISGQFTVFGLPARGFREQGSPHIASRILAAVDKACSETEKTK